jgi:hypothetical protein
MSIFGRFYIFPYCSRKTLCSLILPFGFIGVLFLGFPEPATPCVVACVEYQVSSTRGSLVDSEDHPMLNAEIIIRDASQKASGPEAPCNSRRGPVVKRIRTNEKGYFNLSGLQIGEYWVTYMDPKEGESFLINLTTRKGGKRFKLGVDHWEGSLCYVVDVERNESKPPGAVKPVQENDQLAELLD